MNDKISMQSVRTLVRLEMRARFGSRVDTTAKDKAGKALGIIFTLAIYAILVTGIYFLAAMFVRRSDMPFEFLVVAMTFTVCVTTVVAIGNVVKNLYLSGDNELLLRFPVNGKEILLAKSIYCFIHNVVINLLIMIPVCAIYGAVSSAPVGFYFVAIAVMIVAIPLPYAIANLLAIPVMMLMNLVKNQFLLVLILLIAAICGVFILYMTALSGVLEYMRDEGEGMFSPEVMSIFRNFADGAYPFRWYAMLLGGWFSGYSAKDAGLAFLYIFLITAAISVAAYFVTTRTYYKIILIGIETEKVSFQKKIPNIKRSVFGTLLHREFFLILRSFNYSFQYLAMAVAAPVMVYYCNDLAATMGKNTVGAAIVPGLTLLVIIIFSAIIVSFASTSISREGSAFYHTKIVPVSYTTQIFAKLVLYAAVGTASVVLSTVVVAAAFGTEEAGRLLTSLDIGCIFIISEMITLALTCLAIASDVKSPTFNVVGDGEMVSANKNMVLSLVVGIVVAALFGVFTMIFSFLPLQVGDVVIIPLGETNNIYAILGGISAVILAASVAGLFANLERRYQRIAP